MAGTLVHPAKLIAALLVALGLHFFPDSTYSSPQFMDTYFGHENSPGSWTWEHMADGSWTKEWEPFKYRIVFRGLVDGTAHALLYLGADRSLTTYWIAFLFISVLSMVFAFWACDRLLLTLECSFQARLFGLAAWIAIPPVSMAFNLPVQTKEDFLAYGIVFCALRAILRGDWRAVVAICVAGALVRETLLVISALVIVGTDAPQRIKWAALLLPLAVHAVLRATLGMSGYEAFQESNLDGSGLVFVSAFFVFGYAWAFLVPYLLKAEIRAAIRRGLQMLGGRESSEDGTMHARMKALRDAFPLLLVVLFTAHFFMGRIQEVRITALLSPFVVLAVVDFLRPRVFDLRSLFLVAFACGSAFIGLIAVEYANVMGGTRRAINPEIGEFAHQRWWLAFYVHLVLGLGVAVAHWIARLEARTSSADVYEA